MLASPQATGHEIARVSIQGRDFDALLDKQWLLTNERGSYASSTIVGCNTSGYHGLLIGSLNPPVNRIMALSTCLEQVHYGGRTFELSTFDFGDRLVPTGHGYLREFRRDAGVHFLYELDGMQVHKAVYLARERDLVVIEYTFDGAAGVVELLWRPLVGLRDFHLLQRSDARMACDMAGPGVLVHHEAAGLGQLLLGAPAMRFTQEPRWWFGFTYRVNRERGLPCTEDLWTPGYFAGRFEPADRVVLHAQFRDRFESDESADVDADALKQDLVLQQDELLGRANAACGAGPDLVLAASQFVVRRHYAASVRSTILAGFPWFADWGRDAFIALPGLLLVTGRFDEAQSVLSTFATAMDRGMIPNRFDDRRELAHFNSVDASLWFIHAAFEYLDATDDATTFARTLLPAVEAIIDAYHTGTRYGIHADSDGLIMAGDADTQLTWMDARCDGIAFTPRYGKAVEVNALWHNALSRTHEYCRAANLPDADRYARLADAAARSFSRLFWNEQQGYLNDVVLPDGAVDASLRPNQIFAISLPYAPPLAPQRRQAVVAAVERELLTPYGLRTLSRREPGYKGHYGGSPRQRDEAYHQGTVWPYLIGPFIEAYLKVHGFSRQSRRRAAQMLDPLMCHLTASGCLGSIAEILDGDPPHTPRGCLAQAWSVAECLRAQHLIHRGEHPAGPAGGS